MGLFFIGVIGFVVSIIAMLIIGKKKKKLILCFMGGFFVIAIIGMLVAMNTPAIDIAKADYKTIMAGEVNDKMVEIKGDIKSIETVGELYVITMVASDGEYTLVTTADVSGKMPQEGDKLVKAYVTPSYTSDGTLTITVISFPT